MQITSFKLSADKTTMNVTITDAASLTSLLLWTDNTYKDFTKAKDLSSKLTGSATETITISPSDIGETFFDGLYYLESKDANQISIAALAELRKYKECVVKKVLALDPCEDCDRDLQEILNIDVTIKALEYATQFLAASAMQTMIKLLDKYCEGSCDTCGKRNANVLDNNSNDQFDPDTIVVTIDGGTD